MSDLNDTTGLEAEAMVGLDDRSEELSERSEETAQIRFYRAMADTEADFERTLSNLARAVAEVISDFCVVFLKCPQADELQAPAAFHPHPPTLRAIRRAFCDDADPLLQKLVSRVILREEAYFRPRWRPSLLQAYGPPTEESPSTGLDLALHSLMIVPLMSTDGTCTGALFAARHATALSYDETDLALLEWIASHAAMKLETARLYQDLQRANGQLDLAVQARDTFISIASHELRTPLSTLKLQAEVLRRATRHSFDEITPEMLHKKLDGIDHQVDLMGRLLDQLLNVSRIIDGGLQVNYEPCDLKKITTTVLRRFSSDLEASGSVLRFTSDDQVQGEWDRDRLAHILSNLISNAIKYGQGNPIDVHLQRSADEAILTVTDGGYGIDRRDHEKIFQRFERVVTTGTSKGIGLGLWIVRKYVDSMQGVVEVESEPGQGSTFRVILPIMPA